MVKEFLENTIAEIAVIEKTEIKPTSHLKNDLGMDSLDIVEMTMEIEKKYNIILTGIEDEFPNSTVEEVVALIEKAI
jgi:acyl carrier protein